MERNTCPKCSRQLAAGEARNFCPACLMEEAMRSAQCPSCASEIADEARFCGQCGAVIPDGTAQEGDPLRRALEAKLKGQYRLVRLLGRGGMGAVYLARDLVLDREVAIKVVSTVAGTRELKERFRREARTAAKLSHSNIVPLHSFGEVEGMPYFVMGYVRGESLGARLRRDGRIAEDEARRILADVADALDHAHRQGVIHRDIKPDNVLLDDESGRALLTDFGVAKAMGQGETLTHFGNVVGTPQFMSPEQASGTAVVDGRSDLYSLGVMGYAMVAGRLPFEGGSAADVLTRHLTQSPPPLRSFVPALSDSTVRAIERCLVKDPADRWPDAASLRRELGMTVSEDNRLPDDLRAVEGSGVIGTLGFLFFSYWGTFGGGGGINDLEILPYALAILWIFWLVAHLFALGRLRIEGYSFSQTLHAMYQEPSWWPTWYPRSLRRPGNVWERLPASVKMVRSWLLAFALFALYMINWIERANRAVERIPVMRGKFLGELFAVGGAVLVGFILLFVSARSSLRRKGLDSGDAQRVAFGVAPSRVTFWMRPQIAAVLKPAEDINAPHSDSPNDQLQSILRNANDLSGHLRPLGAQAAAAGRQLLAAIEEADREIAGLAQTFEPGEDSRLADKIAALTLEEQAPLRDLLEKQLEIIQGLSARIEQAQARRNGRVELLKMLALHVASLRARPADTTSEVRELSDNVKALCDDIAREAAVMSARDAATTLTADAPTQQRTPRI